MAVLKVSVAELAYIAII